MASFKHWFFRNYWWIYCILFLAFLVSFNLSEIREHWEVVATVMTILISSFFFIQKQKLEELKLLQDLFIEFNKKYDKMNNKLNKIVKKEKDEDLIELAKGIKRKFLLWF